jgi:hypothetical protein
MPRYTRTPAVELRHSPTPKGEGSMEPVNVFLDRTNDSCHKGPLEVRCLAPHLRKARFEE